MNVLFPIWDIIIAALLVLAAPSGFAGGCLQRNPPGSTEGDASSPCGCQTGGDSVGADCIMVNLEMGEVREGLTPENMSQ